MKKLILIMLAPFAFLSASLAQVTQAMSDSIVLERMSQETRQYAVYAQIEVQTEGVSITTSMNEVLELTYSCRVYYVNYLEEADTNRNHYLIVKESSGNLLEVRTQNNVVPADLAAWRIIPEEPEEPPLDSLVLIAKGILTGDEGIRRQHLIITTQTKWDSLLTIMNSVNNVSDNFAETDIDFSKYRVVAVFDEVRPTAGWSVDITDVKEYPFSIVVTYTNLDTGNLNLVITQPYYIIKVPITEKPIVFHDVIIPNKYPTEIPFTEYVLGDSCQWAGLNYSNDTMIIINSNAELENYITCNSDGTYPVIDFIQNSLFLVHRYSDSYGISNITTEKFERLALLEYKLDIEVFLSDTVVFQEEYVAMIVPKFPQNAIMALSATNTIYTKYPMEVPFTEYTLGDSCQWLSFASDTLIIINSNAELENYITCNGGNYPAIDFTQNSLFLVHGYANNAITSITQNFEQISLLNYQLNIDIYLTDTITAVPSQKWHVAMIVPKLTTNAVALNMYYHEPKVLMLMVDYLTNTFQGGKEFVFSNNSNTFTITCQYFEPMLVGDFKLFYKEIDELLFYGTVVRMGTGKMIFPNNLLPQNQFLMDTSNYVQPKNGFEIVFYGYNYGIDPTLAWDSVQSLVIVREYLQSNPNQKVKISQYAPGIGMFDPFTSSWIIYLKR